MGQNLSNLKVADTSLDILSVPDRDADITLAVIWASVFYACGMIWTTCKLLNHWAGPHGDRHISICSGFAALLLSVAWPFVLVFVRS